MDFERVVLQVNSGISGNELCEVAANMSSTILDV
jgi:hypothetical protein